MTAQILDGKAASAAIKAELTERVAALKAQGVTPGIATVLVGADPASQLYVGMKHRQSEAIGMNSIQRELPADATQEQVEALIDELNVDPTCHGYIVQLPLPKHIDTDRILERIDPVKDADGLHPTNLGKLVLNVNSPIKTPLPCTPRGVIELLIRPQWQARRRRRPRRHDRTPDGAAAHASRHQRDGHAGAHRHAGHVAISAPGRRHRGRRGREAPHHGRGREAGRRGSRRGRHP
jgi:hypothetical protein